MSSNATGTYPVPDLALTFGPLEIGITVGIVVLMFGAKKLPLLARGLGSGIRNFKGQLQAPPENVDEAEAEEVERGSG